MATIKEIGEWFKSRGNDILFAENLSLNIDAPRAIEGASKSQISFIGQKYKTQFLTFINSSECELIILDNTLVGDSERKNLPENKSYIFSDNPKEDIVEYCKHFLGFEKTLSESVIASSAKIDNSVSINGIVSVGANVVIEENVIIGNNCKIGANTVIYKGTQIGDNVEIGSNNTIGGVGFGYAQNLTTKEYTQFPHYGAVIIKNNVSIGNNTCIDRGSLSDTVLEEGVKIDNLVHIAHNVKIGKNTLVIAHAMIAGSVTIGENCWIAPSSSIRNGIEIGNNVTVGLASNVTKSVGDNEIVTGNPAVPIEEFKKLREIQKGLMSK